MFRIQELYFWVLHTYKAKIIVLETACQKSGLYLLKKRIRVHYNHNLEWKWISRQTLLSLRLCEIQDGALCGDGLKMSIWTVTTAVRSETSRKWNFLPDKIAWKWRATCLPTELGSRLCPEGPALVSGRKTLMVPECYGNQPAIWSLEGTGTLQTHLPTGWELSGSITCLNFNSN